MAVSGVRSCARENTVAAAAAATPRASDIPLYSVIPLYTVVCCPLARVVTVEGFVAAKSMGAVPLPEEVNP